MPKAPESSAFDRYLRLASLEVQRSHLSNSLQQAEACLHSSVQSLRAAVNKQSTGAEYEEEIETRHKRVTDLQQKLSAVDAEIDQIEITLPACTRPKSGSVLARPTR